MYRMPNIKCSCKLGNNYVNTKNYSETNIVSYVNQYKLHHYHAVCYCSFKLHHSLFQPKLTLLKYMYA